MRRRDDPFATLEAADRRRLLLLGTKLTLVEWVWHHGEPRNGYDAVVDLAAAVRLSCDAVALRLPSGAAQLALALEPDTFGAEGLFVHIAGCGWVNVNTMKDGDLVAATAALVEQCKERENL